MYRTILRGKEFRGSYKELFKQINESGLIGNVITKIK